ncbi:MAG: hypothetical protein H7249_14915 [Chitinophagaceae bacterium]|nr:hypothetical protein [Oligoflexus sp.]
MNGILLFSLMIFFIHRSLKTYSEPLVTSQYWLTLQNSMRSRDYLFRKVTPQNPLEETLRQRFIGVVKQGKLTLTELEALDRLGKRVARQQKALDSLLLTYTTHVCFVVLTPLGLRLGFKGQWFFDRGDFGELGIGLIGLLILASVFHKLWPQSGLTRTQSLTDTIATFVGDTDAECGLWTGAVRELKREAWKTGGNPDVAIKTMLTEWKLDQIEAFDRQIRLLEDALGPMELFTTCYFGVFLLGEPLISHFSGLLL